MSRKEMRACGLLSRIFPAICMLLLLSFPAISITNPAATYCQALGYQYQTVKNDDGSEYGICDLKDGRVVDAWLFLLGLEAEDCSYCAKRGLKMEVVSDPQLCQIFMTDRCAACILEDGQLVEVTRLMNLSFGEDRCGDGICGLSENKSNCLQDCSSREGSS